MRCLSLHPCSRIRLDLPRVQALPRWPRLTTCSRLQSAGHLALGWEAYALVAAVAASVPFLAAAASPLLVNCYTH